MIVGRAVGAGAFFLAILLTGLWVSRRGRPLSSILLNLHKLIGLGAGIFLAVTLVQIGRAATLGTGVVIASVVTGAGMVAGAATGGVLSAKADPPSVLLRLHQAATVVSLAAAAALVCLLK